MNGNNMFWVETYNRNINKLIGVCYRYVSDKQIAEDIAHDAFLVAMKKVRTYKGKGYFDAWLRRITVNEALQYLRDKNKIQQYQEELLRHEKANIGEPEIMKYDFSTQELLKMIDKLPEHHKLVFNLYIIDGFSHNQISNKLDISVGTSKSHLSRAKKKLQCIINEKQSEESKKRSSLFMLLPFSHGNIQKIFRKKLESLKIETQDISKKNILNLNESELPHFNSLFASINTFGTYVFLITTGLGIAGIIIHRINREQINTPMHLEKADTVISIPETLDKKMILLEEKTDTIIQPKPIDKKETVVIKRKRITRKKVIVRDTFIIDTANDK